MANYEIGVVYKKGKRNFLAVTPDTLVTFRDGEVQEIRPATKYEVVRSISCEELCVQWGITLADLDECTSSYLQPVSPLKTRPRGSRKTRLAQEHAWRNLRTIRLAAG